MLTDDAKAIVVLTTRLGSVRRPSLSPGKWHRVWRTLEDGGLRPADLFGSAAPASLGDLADDVTHLMADAGEVLLEADEMDRKGIWVLTVADDGYPKRLVERLGDASPPVLFGAGDRALLAEPGVGIVGSRDVDSAGGEVAQRLARQAVDLGRIVVSGGARGVDQLAMNAAYQAGGSVVGVVADSLLGRIRKPDVLAALDGGSTCLLTQQAPASGFSPAAAMSRNKLIYGFSAVTVVVCSSEGSGGTWSGATEALKANNGVVAVWRGPGEGAGNEPLEQAGAVPLAEPGDIVPLLAEPPTPAEQLSLY